MSPDAVERAQAKCSEAQTLLSRAAETRESVWMLQAIACYGEALELAPELIEPYLGLGHLWLYYEHPEQAVFFLRKALDLEPFHPVAQRLWADARTLLDRPAEQT